MVEIERGFDERQLAAYISIQLLDQARAGDETHVRGDKERLKIRELGKMHEHSKMSMDC